MFNYLLITTAQNEERFIEETIKSVIAQTILPHKWLIVSDGSTDRTNEIVGNYASKYSWIELLTLPKRSGRDFAGKANAFNKGYTKLANLKHDVIGSLDADITFDPEYFEFLLNQFIKYPSLGVAGTPYREGSVQYNYRFSRKEHVSGACQLFRRDCFQSIGGYTPLKDGAIDLVAVVTARMKGWKTETFTEKYCIHHRRMGTATDHILAAAFKSGFGDYRMGVHPIWQFLRSLYQMSRKPIFFYGASLLTGYTWAYLKRVPKSISKDLIDFRHKEQLLWLKEYYNRAFRPNRLLTK